MSANWFDIVSALLILLIGLKGLFNGIVRELAGLVGLVAGVWFGSLYAPELGGWMGRHFVPLDSPSALAMVGFLTLLTLIWLFFVILGVVLEKSLAIPDLGIADKIGGFLIASFKVFVVLAVIVYALFTIEFVRQNAAAYVAKSLFYPWYIKTGEAIFHIHPYSGVKKSELLEKEARQFIKDSEKALEGNSTRKAH